MNQHVPFYIYDFEVMPNNWCVTFKNPETKEYIVIKDHLGQLESFTIMNANAIFIGFNNEGYDKYIWDSILTGWNPYELSQKIIVDNRRPFTFYKKFKYQLINYDIMKNLPHKQSLKMCEANLGLEIKESTTIFKDQLTDKDWEEILLYNKVDVDATDVIWEIMQPDFESKLMLLKMFKLPLSYISKSNAQLTAIILGAKRNELWSQYVTNDILDKDYYIAPDNLVLTKYQPIRDRFGHFIPDDFKPFSMIVAGAKHTFGTGGLHGEGQLHYWAGTLIIADITSYYPNMMVLYKYLSRNVARPELFKEIIDQRVEYKHLSKTDAFASKMADALKLVINTTSGAQRANFNDLYDPRMSKAFCITGQLLMIDLIEKIEPYLGPQDFIQSNTDGIMFELTNPVNWDLINNEIHKWEKRTGLNMEIGFAKRIWQKDVNNYLLEMDDGSIKFKGAWLKSRKGLIVADSLNPANAMVINDAIKAYLLYDIEPEYYIRADHPLIDFQYAAKGGGMYKNFYHFINGEYQELQKVNRVFATTLDNYGTLYKKKADKETYEKIANLPEKCLIINDNIIGNMTSDLGEILDYQYYIDTAWERIFEFLK